MPIIPFVCDSEEMIDDTMKKVEESGGTYAVPGCMTLRQDREESFFGFVKNHFPHLESEFRQLYVNGYVPEGEYARELNRRVLNSCKKHDMKPYMPRYIPEGPLKRNLEVSTILRRLSSLYELREGSSRKSQAFSHVAFSIEHLEEDIEAAFRQGRLRDIKGVGRKTDSVVEEFLTNGKSSLLERLE